MKTKYENFLEHFIHGIDEPKKTFGKFHNMLGFESDKFSLKGKVLSATKIFLSDDFVKITKDKELSRSIRDLTIVLSKFLNEIYP